MVPNAMLMRDVLTEAATTAKGSGVLLSQSGDRDLFGEALHLIGVPARHLEDKVAASHKTISAIGAITVYIEAGLMWDRGKKADAVQWARVWASRRTVGEIRALLREAGIHTEEVTEI